MLLLTDIPLTPSLLPSIPAAGTCPNDQSHRDARSDLVPLTDHRSPRKPPVPSALLVFNLPCLGSLTLIDGAVERLLVRKLRVEAVLRVVGPSSVGVTVPTDLGPLVVKGLRTSIGIALQYHIVAL